MISLQGDLVEKLSSFDIKTFKKDPLKTKIPKMLVGLKFGSDDTHGKR